MLCIRLLISHSHNTELASSASTMRLAGEEGSLECGISAYCAALRIRLYLWRMAVAKRGIHPEEHKQQREDEGFMKHCTRISELIAQEYIRNNNSIRWAGGRPRLISEAISIDNITTQFLELKAEQACSICQDAHPATQCVTLKKCDCTFGRNCLRGLLNQDSPWSNRCPNCRAVLHEPLEWAQPPWSRSQVGLLWNLRQNAHCIQKEIQGRA